MGGGGGLGGKKVLMISNFFLGFLEYNDWSIEVFYVRAGVNKILGKYDKLSKHWQISEKRVGDFTIFFLNKICYKP